MRRNLGTFCYILTGLFGYACPYVRVLKGVVEWAAPNRDAFKRAVLTSHQATDLLSDIPRLLSEYLNTCVQAYCNRGLAQPGSLIPVSLGTSVTSSGYSPTTSQRACNPPSKTLSGSVMWGAWQPVS